jgi:hypothetical protein
VGHVAARALPSRALTGAAAVAEWISCLNVDPVPFALLTRACGRPESRCERQKVVMAARHVWLRFGQLSGPLAISLLEVFGGALDAPRMV